VDKKRKEVLFNKFSGITTTEEFPCKTQSYLCANTSF